MRLGILANSEQCLNQNAVDGLPRYRYTGWLSIHDTALIIGSGKQRLLSAFDDSPSLGLLPAIHRVIAASTPSHHHSFPTFELTLPEGESHPHTMHVARLLSRSRTRPWLILQRLEAQRSDLLPHRDQVQHLPRHQRREMDVPSSFPSQISFAPRVRQTPSRPRIPSAMSLPLSPSTRVLVNPVLNKAVPYPISPVMRGGYVRPRDAKTAPMADLGTRVKVRLSYCVDHTGQNPHRSFELSDR